MAKRTTTGTVAQDLTGSYTLGGFGRRTLTPAGPGPALTVCDTKGGGGDAARYVTSTTFGRTAYAGNLYAGPDKGRSGSAEATADLDGCEFQYGKGGVRYCITRDADDAAGRTFRLDATTTPAGLTT